MQYTGNGIEGSNPSLSAMYRMVHGTANTDILIPELSIVPTMYYVYVLCCNDDKFYIGFTADLKSRLERHQRGYVRATKPRRPLELMFYEAYRNKYDALRREKYLKTTKGKQTLHTMLSEDLKVQSLL